MVSKTSNKRANKTSISKKQKQPTNSPPPPPLPPPSFSSYSDDESIPVKENPHFFTLLRFLFIFRNQIKLEWTFNDVENAVKGEEANEFCRSLIIKLCLLCGKRYIQVNVMDRFIAKWWEDKYYFDVQYLFKDIIKLLNDNKLTPNYIFNDNYIKYKNDIKNMEKSKEKSAVKLPTNAKQKEEGKAVVSLQEEEERRREEGGREEIGEDKKTEGGIEEREKEEKVEEDGKDSEKDVNKFVEEVKEEVGGGEGTAKKEEKKEEMEEERREGGDEVEEKKEEVKEETKEHKSEENNIKGDKEEEDCKNKEAFEKEENVEYQANEILTQNPFSDYLWKFVKPYQV